MQAFLLLASMLSLEPLACEQSLGGDICEEMEATCGYLQNSNGDFVNCGTCNVVHQYCGGSAPNRDGSPGEGVPLTCGGGCSEVTSFSCDLGIPILCSLPGNPPYDYCSDEEDGKWCC